VGRMYSYGEAARKRSLVDAPPPPRRGHGTATVRPKRRSEIKYEMILRVGAAANGTHSRKKWSGGSREIRQESAERGHTGGKGSAGRGSTTRNA